MSEIAVKPASVRPKDGAGTLAQGDNVFPVRVMAVSGAKSDGDRVCRVVHLLVNPPATATQAEAVTFPLNQQLASNLGLLPSLDNDALRDELIYALSVLDHLDLTVPFDRHRVADELMEIVSRYVDWADF